MRDGFLYLKMLFSSQMTSNLTAMIFCLNFLGRNRVLLTFLAALSFCLLGCSRKEPEKVAAVSAPTNRARPSPPLIGEESDFLLSEKDAAMLKGSGAGKPASDAEGACEERRTARKATSKPRRATAREPSK